MAKPEMKTIETTNSCDLRDWLDDVEALGQLERISGAHWDLEIGALTEIILERLSFPPAVMFEDVPGYASKRRVLANMLETLERTALTLNLPTNLKTIPLIDALRAKFERCNRSSQRSFPPVLSWRMSSGVSKSIYSNSRCHVGTKATVAATSEPRIS